MGERPLIISPEIWQELQESKEAVIAKAAAGNGASEGSAPPKRAHPPGFRMASNGLLWTDPSDDEKPEIVVSGPFEIVAESRDDGRRYKDRHPAKLAALPIRRQPIATSASPSL